MDALRDREPVGINLCPRCGVGLNPEAHYCMRCGTEVAGSDASGSGSDRNAGKHNRDSYLDRLRAATLGDYDVGPILGSGGMAVVYKAMDLRLHRSVAIKVMAEPRPWAEEEDGYGAAERFLREVRMTASLVHRHIVPVYAVSDHPDLHYFVMRYIDGCPLDHLIARTLAARGKVPFGVTNRVAAEVASALGFAHGRNVIHRDIKPANIMIDRETGDSLVADFGIARALDETHMTGAGVLGTPRYMSPEQARGDEGIELTGASDQYSLGILMYEMITGRVPFTGKPLTLLTQHNFDPPPPITTFRPDCPPELCAIVTRLLAKDPCDRWPSMQAVHGAITEIVDLDEEMTTAVLLETATDGANQLNARLPRTPQSPRPAGMPRSPGPARNPNGSPPSKGRTWLRVVVLVLGLAVAVTAGGSVPAGRPAAPGDRVGEFAGEHQEEIPVFVPDPPALEVTSQPEDPAPLQTILPESTLVPIPPPQKAVEEAAEPPPASPAVLQVRMTPWAHATIGDRVFSSRSWVVDTLAAGVVHRVRFERPGFTTQDTTIVLRSGENRRLTIRLIRSEPDAM